MARKKSKRPLKVEWTASLFELRINGRFKGWIDHEGKKYWTVNTADLKDTRQYRAPTLDRAMDLLMELTTGHEES